MRSVLHFAKILIVFMLVGFTLSSMPLDADIGLTNSDTVQPGDIVVLNQGSLFEASVLRFDPVSGVKTIISQGGLLSNLVGENPTGFVYDASGQRFLIVDRKEDLVAIDLDGNQTLITGNLPMSGTSSAIAVEDAGTLVIADTGSRVIRFDPTQATSSVISEGGLLEGLNPWAVQIDENGDIIIGALRNPDIVGLPSRLIRIDPVTGEQSLIAETVDRQFRDFSILGNIAFIVMAARGGAHSDDIVAALDLQSGDYVELVTGLERALDVDLDSAGELIILDQTLKAGCGGTGDGAIYRLENSGLLTLLSSCGPIDCPGRLLVFPTIGNRPPTADAGPNQTVDADFACTANVTLDGSASTDPDSTSGTNDDIVSFEWVENGTPFGSGETLNYTFPLGVHTITLIVTDSFGETASDQVVITVEDTTPPEISLSVSPDSLWPPHHKMVLCTLTINVSDNCDPNPAVQLVSVTSNESEEVYTYDPAFDIYTSEGNTDDDIQIVNGDIYLRAERSAHGDGRIYTITYEATDASGNSATASATVTVAHN